MFYVSFLGFKTKQQAFEFLSWYEGGGEQFFYEHLACLDKSPRDGCNIDMTNKGNSGLYYDEFNFGYEARIKSYK